MPEINVVYKKVKIFVNPKLEFIEVAVLQNHDSGGGNCGKYQKILILPKYLKVSSDYHKAFDTYNYYQMTKS